LFIAKLLLAGPSGPDSLPGVCFISPVQICGATSDFKEKFAKYVAGKITDPNCEFDFQPLQALLKALLAKIDLHEPA
jgi:hypothetical protein